MLTVFLFGIAAAAAELLGGVIIALRPVWPRRIQEFLLAVGAGFILALAFLKLIPESIEALGETAAIVVLLGFAAMHFFEHTIVRHLHFGEETHADVMVSGFAGVSAVIGLSIHGFFDGVSISAGLQFDYYLGLLIFIAVLLHKLPEGLTIGSVIVAAGFPRRRAVLAAGGLGIATLLGVASVFLFSTIEPQVVGFAFAFSAGAATYVGASDLIPEINRTDSRIPPIIVLFGMLLFYGSDMLLEGLLG